MTAWYPAFMGRARVLPAWAFAAVSACAIADDGVPAPDHVVIVIEENHGYAQIIGAAAAPYINSLAAGGALMTASYAITHPSQPNYIAFFSGSTQGVTTDNMYPHSLFVAPNLGAKILASARGLTFGGYSETMPSVGYDGISAGNSTTGTYQRKHNPWVNWQDPGVPLPPNKLPSSVNMPFAGYFPSDYSTLPTLSFVIPNQLHDMHDGTIAQADQWLQANLSAYATWCQTHNSLLVVTFDEDNGSYGNRIATIFYGPMVVPAQYAESITHYTVLRTLEDMFGLPHDANTVSVHPITDIWAAPPACYANCDGSTTPPVLNVNDFLCFLNRFAAGDSWANCDGSTEPPVLNVNDLICFQGLFAAGCR
jgi:phosphatidylinositol-3-phosphatase